MRLASIDESYTRDYYFIAAVVVDDASAPARTTISETNPKATAAMERIWGHVAGRVEHEYLYRP